MAQSPLLGGERAARRPPGTGTDVLGPSDTSDTGSDIAGAAGAVDTDDIGFDGGSNDDVRRAPGAGADIGDADLDADSDSGGTGERAEAGRDTLRRDSPDVMPDRVESVAAGAEEEMEDLDDLASAEDVEQDADEDEGRAGGP